MKVGDKIVCVNDSGLSDYGIRKGDEYIANSIQDMTAIGDKVYISVFHNGKVVYTLASRFEVVEEG